MRSTRSYSPGVLTSENWSPGRLPKVRPTVEGTPRGAYDLLERLAADGHRPSPPTVYRALDFLLRQGLVHRVSSRNAFVGCNHPGDDHMAQLFICDRCDVAFEQADGSLNRRIRRNAMDLQFKIRTQTVEIAGLCPRCAGRSDGA